MITSLLSFFSGAGTAIGSAFVGVLMSVASLFGYAHPVDPGPLTVITPAKKPPPKAPIKVPPKPVVVVPPVVTPPPAESTTTELQTIGATTLAVQSIPLLSGGVVHSGGTVPVSYLQITNVGTAGALLKGFWITQNGSASLNAIGGFSTIDDRGGSRGVSSGAQGSALFQSGVAFASTTAYFAPGQMRLFTIKVLLSTAVADYVGTELKLEVASIETTGETQGNFPIVGTTWVIAQ
jgi:hypothetical protein